MPVDRTFDLERDIAATLTVLREGEGPISVLSVLETLGVRLTPPLRSPNPVATTLEASASPGAFAHGPTAVPSSCGQAPVPGEEASSLSLGRFQLLGELGRGGMGRVLEALDPELHRTVAVKVVIDPRRVSGAQLARFVAEAQITSQLEHPNIVPVYDMGMTEDGELFFVMKKVEGHSLRQVLSRVRKDGSAAPVHLSRHRLLNGFVQVCQAIAYAHERGVLHRDLKPDNIMLGRFAEVLVMDWGVARLVGDTSEVVAVEAIERVEIARTLDGAAIGTPGYMSPEQARGDIHLLDARSDVWSLGAILYEILTLRPAYEAPSIYALLNSVLCGAPRDPRERAPEREIPEEIAGVCLRALAPEPEDRFASAADLASAVEAFLEGSRRQKIAAQHVAEGEEAWARYLALDTEREELLRRLEVLDREIEPWRPLADKAELLSLRRRLVALRRDRVDRFEEVVAACEHALSHDPDGRAARSLLARAYFRRFEEAERAGAEDERLHCERRVRRHDDGTLTPQLTALGTLSLRTDPPGAAVTCRRFVREGLVWPLEDERELGRTPLRRFPLEPGSYLLTLRHGERSARYPVLIERGQEWDSGPVPVQLPRPVDLGDGFAWIPPGPIVSGGDPLALGSLPRSVHWVDGFSIAVDQVTMAQWCEFLTDLHQRDPEAAWGRVPRAPVGVVAVNDRYFERPAPGGRYRVPEVDDDGDRWDPRWPVMSISWEDARAYAAWRSERDGRPCRLPTELEWEKAARGVDGRSFPWGDEFDATLCHTRSSRPGPHKPEPIGSFPEDRSVYGVRDMAGGARDWTCDLHFDDDPSRRPIRGGAWNSVATRSRLAARMGLGPFLVLSYASFRLVRPG